MRAPKTRRLVASSNHGAEVRRQHLKLRFQFRPQFLPHQSLHPQHPQQLRGPPPR